MQGKKQFEHTRNTVEALHRKVKLQQENKRMRAKAYRLKKKQRESEREYNLQITEKLNTSLRDEVRRLREEMERMSVDLTFYQQLLAQSYLSAQSYHQAYHRYPGNNETWTTTGWDDDSKQLAIEGPSSNEALLMMQKDNQSDNDNDDLTNNQGVNSGETTMHNEELPNYMENI